MMPRFFGLLLLSLTAASAQPLLPVFTESEAVPVSKAARGGGVRASSAARIRLNRELFDATSAERLLAAKRDGKRVRLLLNPGSDAWPLVLDDARVWAAGETVTWTGHLDTPLPGSFSLALSGSQLSGHIATGDGRIFELRGDAGETIVEEFDPKSMRWSCDSRTGLEAAAPPSAKAFTEAPRQVGPAVTVDVMVAYTTQATQAAGGEAAMLNQIREAVAYTNQSYANTGLDFRINLVDTLQVTMAEDGTCNTPLNRLTGKTDGVIDEIHARRDQVGADLVSLLISRGDCGGLAWVMNQNSTSFESRGFSVVLSTSPTFWRNISFAHELGHNMGSLHDRRNSDGQGLFPYSYGYQSFEAQPFFRDIMAYECSGGVTCPNQAYFASPDVTISGRPGGKPSNAFDSADVRLTFINSITNVSNFRPSRNAPPSGGVSLSPSTIPVPAGGATGVAVNLTATGAWQASTTASWITGLTPTSGTGSATLRFNVAANSLSDTRRGSILAGGASALVEQSPGLACPVTAATIGPAINGTLGASSCTSPIRQNTRAARYSFFGSQGQQVSIALNSTSFDTYLYLLQPNGALAAENDDLSSTNTNSRIPANGFFTLPSTGTYVIEVTTFAANATGAFTLTITSPSCGYTLNPASLSVSALQADSNVAVQTQTGCTWTASSSVPWVSITTNSSNAGPGNVGLRVFANNTNAARSGVVTIGGQTLNVTQASPAGCAVGPIAPGAAVSGQLTANQTCRSAYAGAARFAARYTFNGTAGQQVRLLLQSPTLDTYLYLIGPNGSIAAEDDDSAGDLNSVIPSLTGFFTLPTTGAYIVEATTFEDNAAGSFTLLLSTSGGGNTGSTGPLTPGIPRTVQLPAIQSAILFNAEANLLRVDVPANATRLEVRLTSQPDTADVDLFANFATPPTVGSDGRVVSNHASTGNAGSEVIVITPASTPPLRAGTYVIALALFTPGVAVTSTVTATISTGAGGPAPTVAQAVHGASFQPVVASGSWVTVFGTNLAPAGVARIWRDNEIVGGVLPTVLEGTSVTIGGRPASVYFVSPTQLNVQAPAGLPPGSTLVEVTTPGGTARGSVTYASISPALFPVAQSANIVYAAIQDSRFALIAPPALVPGARGARRGESLLLYATGLGNTNPPQTSGVVPSVAPLANPARVTIGGVDARVDFAGLIGAGLYQINIVVPTNIGTGDQPLVLTVGGVASPGSVRLPVAN
ncbi:MAG: pre-peptidase C-terminal domain-containing protein [Bryobacteraceae bacterium]|nr:pre-peptidase C-terminal domain-containing protein [Bryobacteraceae bacterium]